MTTLSNELKAVISRRLDAAPPREVFAIAAALCDQESLRLKIERVVRSEPETDPARFTIDGDTVRDRTTGLVWTRENVPGGRMSWKDAQAACEKLELGGFGDWRLPTIRELLTLVDYERHDPAIDTDTFECESAWYWSSSPYAPSPGDCAWFVLFNFGDASYGARGNYGFVRAVRAGQ